MRKRKKGKSPPLELEGISEYESFKKRIEEKLNNEQDNAINDEELSIRRSQIIQAKYSLLRKLTTFIEKDYKEELRYRQSKKGLKWMETITVYDSGHKKHNVGSIIFERRPIFESLFKELCTRTLSYENCENLINHLCGLTDDRIYVFLDSDKFDYHDIARKICKNKQQENCTTYSVNSVKKYCTEFRKIGIIEMITKPGSNKQYYQSIGSWNKKTYFDKEINKRTYGKQFNLRSTNKELILNLGNYVLDLIDCKGF